MKTVKKFVVGIVTALLFVFVFSAQSYAQKRISQAKPRTQTAKVLINERGFSRTSITLRRGVPTRLTFLRQTDSTCATSIIISGYGINRELPLNTPVVVSFAPKQSGEVGFTCGMNMMRGKLIVQ